MDFGGLVSRGLGLETGFGFRDYLFVGVFRIRSANPSLPIFPGMSVVAEGCFMTSI